MFRALEAASQRSEDTLEVSAQESGGVEPKAWEDPASEQAALRRGDLLILLLPQFPPHEAILSRNPGEIFADAVAAVSAFFLAQVVSLGASDDLNCQLGRPFKVIIVGNARLPALGWLFGQDQVRRRFVFKILADSGRGRCRLPMPYGSRAWKQGQTELWLPAEHRGTSNND
jgi:hypothetical protein